MANGKPISVSVYGAEPTRFIPERTVVASPALPPGTSKKGPTAAMLKREAKLALKKASKKEKSVAKFERFLKGGRILKSKPPF